MNGNESALPAHGLVVDASGSCCGEFVKHLGVTKRELFAAMAMQGAIAHGVERYDEGGWRELAQAWVKAADVLLAELSKKPD